MVTPRFWLGQRQHMLGLEARDKCEASFVNTMETAGYPFQNLLSYPLTRRIAQPSMEGHHFAEKNFVTLLHDVNCTRQKVAVTWKGDKRISFCRETIPSRILCKLEKSS